MELETFFVPDIGSGLVQVILTVINLALILGGITLSAYSAVFIIRRIRKIDDRPVKKFGFFIAWIVSAIVTAILVWLSIFASRDMQVPSTSSDILGNDAVYRLILNILNPVLDVKSIANSPIPYFFGLNLIARVFILYAFIASTLYVSKMVKKLAKWFSEFLDDKFFNESEDISDHNSEENPDDEDEKADESENDSKKDGVAEGDASSKKAFEKILQYLLPGTGGIGLLAYIFGTPEIRDGINEIIDAVNTFLDIVTLNSKIDPNVTGVSVFISNFLFMVLNIFILAVYVAIVVMFYIFLHAVWSKRVEIKEWILTKNRLLWTCVGIVALVVIAGVVLFITGSGFGDIKGVFDGIFKDGSSGLFQILVYFALFILALCIICLLFAFLISFVIFISYFTFHVIRSIFISIAPNYNGTEKDEKITKLTEIARVIACIIMGIFLFIVIFVGYEPIRDKLNDIFYPHERFSFEPLRVFASILLLGIIVACALLSLIMLSVTASVILWSLGKLFRQRGKKLAEDLSVILDKLLIQIFKMPTLISFTLKHAGIAAKTSIATMLKIFSGYEKESDKNKAVFLAACFASLASLLNTFFGLYGFYNDKSIIIPAICSFAIACAVQLAMLIFGMKAGEGIAERILTNRWHSKNGIWRAIVSKIFYCCIYGFVYYAVYNIIRHLLQESKSTIKMNEMWINIITRGSFLVLGYAVIVQIIELVKLLVRHFKRKDKDADKSYDVSILPYSDNPLRIPYNLYLIAYLLLMLVSTGFAFNNLFGYYANNAKIHERVYEQVRYETDEQLDLFEKLRTIREDYTSNATKLLSIIEQRADVAKKKQSAKYDGLNKLVIEENKDPALDHNGEPSALYEMQKNRNNFKLATSDLEEIISVIKTYLNIDFEAIGSDNEIIVYTYEHYWRLDRAPSYTTKSFNIGESEVGKQMHDNDPMEEVTMKDGNNKKLPSGRREDPDNIYQSIIVTERAISHADKYTIIKELFSYYEELERIILSYDTDDEESDDTDKKKLENFYALLDHNSLIDSVRRNIAELYKNMSQGNDNIAISSLSNENLEDIITIMDLPRIVDEILNLKTTTNMSIVEADSQNLANTPQEDTVDLKENSELSDANEPSKEEKYAELDEYIERALRVYNILAAYTESDEEMNEATANSTESDEEMNEATANSTESNEETKEPTPILSSVYQTQQYKNYAQGITYSDFLISYDALVAGWLRLNPVKATINALYSSRVVAVFILLICIIVDFMAFFAGLLLFKDVYLIDKSSKLSELGYVNYETALTNLFSLPKDKSAKMLQLTFIYTLLYGDVSKCDEPEANLDTSELHKNMKSEDFNKYYEKGIAMLKELGIFEKSIDNSKHSVANGSADSLTYCSYASLRLWLDNYVKKNNITFDMLFPGAEPNNVTDTEYEDEIGGVLESDTNDDDEAFGIEPNDEIDTESEEEIDEVFESDTNDDEVLGIEPNDDTDTEYEDEIGEVLESDTNDDDEAFGIEPNDDTDTEDEIDEVLESDTDDKDEADVEI